MLSLKGKLATILGLIAILVIGTSYTTNAETGTKNSTGSSSEVSRVEYFSIQSNVACGNTASKFRTVITFNLSNVSDVPVNSTIYLYKKDGTQFTGKTPSAGGVDSDITPGTQFTISPNSTVQYYSFFDEMQTASEPSFSCDDRPTYGKVVVNSNGGMLIGSGGVSSLRFLDKATPAHWEQYYANDIELNSGKPF
ncbi:hypothetical protein MHH96_01280 [Niallia sp. FSL K6-0212]|uniref:hypothetical protein n=1 Tax=Niallia sp. FSL K6-0212 TaxID=2921423 RepID=UPI0030F8B5F6